MLEIYFSYSVIGIAVAQDTDELVQKRTALDSHTRLHVDHVLLNRQSRQMQMGTGTFEAL